MPDTIEVRSQAARRALARRTEAVKVSSIGLEAFVVNVFGVIMRVYSYLFHLVLGLILIAISAVTLIGGAHNLKLGMLPWSGATLTYSLLALGALGVILVGLAVRGSLRIAFFLWSLVVVGFLVKGYIFSSYVFSGPGEFWKALIFILGSILAVVGAWFSWKQAPASR